MRRLPQDGLEIGHRPEAEQTNPLLWILSCGSIGRVACEAVKPKLARGDGKPQLVAEQNEAGFNPQQIGRREPCWTGVLRQQCPDWLACVARQHDLKTSLTGIAKPANAARHPGNARTHMREVGKLSKR